MSVGQMEMMTIETDREARLARDLLDARAEVAIFRSQLAASWDRERAQQAVISGLRRELLECRDRLGRDHCDLDDSIYSTAPNPFRDFGGDRRRVGG